MDSAQLDLQASLRELLREASTFPQIHSLLTELAQTGVIRDDMRDALSALYVDATEHEQICKLMDAQDMMYDQSYCGTVWRVYPTGEQKWRPSDL